MKTTIQVCSVCGMWINSARSARAWNSDPYCCEGCMDGSGCTCAGEE